MEKLDKGRNYYILRLTALAKSNEKYDIVIEDKHNVFFLYQEFNFANANSQRANFKAILSFNQDNIALKIKMRTRALLSIIAFYLFVLIVSIILLYQGDFSFLFFMFVALIATVAIPISRFRFKKFIIRFLNNI